MENFVSRETLYLIFWGHFENFVSRETFFLKSVKHFCFTPRKTDTFVSRETLYLTFFNIAAFLFGRLPLSYPHMIGDNSAKVLPESRGMDTGLRENGNALDSGLRRNDRQGRDDNADRIAVYFYYVHSP